MCVRRLPAQEQRRWTWRGKSGKSSEKMLICGKFTVMRVASEIRESSHPWRTTTEEWKLFILSYCYVYFKKYSKNLNLKGASLPEKCFWEIRILLGGFQVRKKKTFLFKNWILDQYQYPHKPALEFLFHVWNHLSKSLISLLSFDEVMS